MGKVWPLEATGASGVPGETSTKKLPSRNVRGRIAKVASSWIGRPWLVIVIWTWAARHAVWSLADGLHPGSGVTAVTVPTLTPAIRTRAPGRIPLALANVALTVYWPANGLANLV